METTGVGGVQAAIAAQKASSKGFQDLGSEDFFALLIAQLQAQDPLNPTSNQELLDQMSSIRQMEQTSQLNSTLTTLAEGQRTGNVAGLIGHYVAGSVTDSGGNAVEIQGLVIGVRFEGKDKVILELHNGKSLPAEAVEQVTLVENLPPEILERLQQELEAGGTTPNQSGGAASRALLADGVAKPAARSPLGASAGPASNPVADLFNALLGGGVAVGA